MISKIFFFVFCVATTIFLDFCMSTVDESASESSKPFRWALRGFYSCGFCVSFVCLLMEGFGMV